MAGLITDKIYGKHWEMAGLTTDKIYGKHWEMAGLTTDKIYGKHWEMAGLTTDKIYGKYWEMAGLTTDKIYGKHWEIASNGRTIKLNESIFTAASRTCEFFIHIKMKEIWALNCYIKCIELLAMQSRVCVGFYYILK